MRLTRRFSLPLLLASPLLLAACSPSAAPPAADEAAPPPMTGAAPAQPDTPTPPPTTAAPDDRTASAVESGPNAPADAAAQDAGQARTRIERVLGDADSYERVFKALQQGVASEDRAAVATLMRYPLRVETAAGKREIADAAAFQHDYAQIITKPVAQAIAAQSFDTVFANQQGVMIGSGQVWLNGTCVDQACSRSDVKVVTIQE
ncbi:hypothetical protein [Stenotrophomonas sp. CFBP 13718]|uniref:hypothetical protein n=1 Tax=Stenotrophomonas sp. CFBP 13718 TaxID=2775304 RepID=UPI00178043C9|nr:hypothetical protein [Stenotrophomonas sp. CFBP 13718]MBD8697581.1 hypothetical protein [Stenotrophomonas sp. CFBP 13718]